MKYATLPLVAFLPKCIRIRAPPDAARSEYFLSREISPSREGTPAEPRYSPHPKINIFYRNSVTRD